jgi:hypothetical protein
MQRRLTKNHQDEAYPLPPRLEPLIEDYLHVVRPQLGGASCNQLWMSLYRTPMQQDTLAAMVRRWIRRWFGETRGPHWLRKCRTTTVAFEAPELMLDAGLLMNHSPAVQLQNYNMATGIIAGRRHNARIGRLKRDLAALAAEAYGWEPPKKGRKSVAPSPKRRQK